jgi:hypothetical protein
MTAKSLKSTKLTMEIDDGKEPKIDKVINGGQKRQRAQNWQNRQWRSTTAMSPKSTKSMMVVDDGNEPETNKIDNGGWWWQWAQNWQNQQWRLMTAKSPKISNVLVSWGKPRW